MKIMSFRIENFRNLRLAECESVPDFMVICGGNGCGKSALLEALMTAKEHAGAYGNFPFDPRAVSASESKATIKMNLSFSENERQFIKEKYGHDCPDVEEIIIEIDKGGSARPIKSSPSAHQLLSYYGHARGSPGFFDYINAHRQIPKFRLQTWDPSVLTDARSKETLVRGDQKYQFTKQYLVGLKMHDLQELQSSLTTGEPVNIDSLKEIREFFDQFFYPMTFRDVLIHDYPFEFVISTPQGDIDIDDLSSGEKEVLNTFIRFHQLNPRGAVILFDEADAHLHPDLERRYLDVLRQIGKDSQLIITTHSPEMMIAAGTDSLYTVLKQQPTDGSNQLVRVTQSEQMHRVLSDIMGSRGIVSFNQRIIFIEGEDASADRDIYEAAYPPSKYNISFVPAGNSATVRKIAEQVNKLLETSVGFQYYFSIVDGDIERFEADPTYGRRLFRLPVYHVENLLLDENEIFDATRQLMGSKCPYSTSDEVRQELISLVLSEKHLKPYVRAIVDAKLAKKAKEASDEIFKNQANATISLERIDFSGIETETVNILKTAIDEETWKSKCKGRDLLRAYCGIHNIRYEHLRNLLISRIKNPPNILDEIMKQIL